MSIQGQSFNGPFSTGSHIDFGVGIGGMADIFSSDYTIAVLEKGSSNNRGFFGAYGVADGTSPIRQFFVTNNSGGRMYSDGDFSNGYPDPADLASPALADNVWRWETSSKATGSAHYKNGYADLSTLTWHQGESVGAGNHGDSFVASVMLSTWAAYPNGFGSQDIAAIVVWPYQLSEADIRASCTGSLADVYAKFAPKLILSFKESDVASTIIDLTGNGANESSRQFIIGSADPPGFIFTLDPTTRETLWTPSNGPAPTDFVDASDGVPEIATGVSFTVTETGTITAVRFFATTNARTGGGNYTVNLFEVTADDNTPASTLLSSSAAVPATSLIGGTWNEIPLTTPVTVQPGHLYRASLHSGSSGRYVATTDYFNFGTDHFSAAGHVKAWHNGDNPTGLGTANQGTFTIGSGGPTTFPYHTTGANYWIDVVYSPGGAPPPSFDTRQFFPYFN